MIKIKYKINNNERNIQLFGITKEENKNRTKELPKNQRFFFKKKCRIISNNKQMNKIKFIIKVRKNSEMEKIIKVKLLDDLLNINSIFYNCSSINSISNLNLKRIKNISSAFYGCSNLKGLPDISKWNISEAKDISYLFSGCKSLESIPDLSKWDTGKVINMKCLFNECSSLKLLPDISKWNITVLIVDIYIYLIICTFIRILGKIF